jgi:hypothetical protein
METGAAATAGAAEDADVDGDGTAGTGGETDGDVVAAVLAGPAAVPEPACTVPQPARLISTAAITTGAVVTDRAGSKLAKRVNGVRTVASWHEQPGRTGHRRKFAEPASGARRRARNVPKAG